MNRFLASVGVGMLFGVLLQPVGAQTSGNLVWVRDYATPDASGKNVNENRLNGDPRFHALLRASFHQGQTFWIDHGSFPSLADLVHQFIGVPGEATIDQDRYVTANGCVPHDCNDGGFVWIDTRGEGKPLVIFVATGAVSGGVEKDALMHLRVFASRRINWQQMPPSFLQSLSHWYTAGQVKYLSYRVEMVTLVQPNGQEVDLAPSLFEFRQPVPTQ